jgi:hypothetical protein
VSKWGCHNRIRDGLVPILTKILKTLQVIHPSSTFNTEPTGIIPNILNCRPFDIFFRPDSNPAVYDQTPCPFTEIGFDITITPSKSHLSSSSPTAATTNSAIAKHLNKKEKLKLQRAGMVDSLSNFVSSNEIIGSLSTLTWSLSHLLSVPWANGVACFIPSFSALYVIGVYH